MNKLQLFEPGRIGRLTLKNRIIMAPMATLLGEPVADSRLSQRGLDFYEARARGGVGLIIPGVVRVSLRFEPSVGEQAISSQRSVQWINDLVELVHSHGAKICIQLSPGMGRNQVPNPALPHGGTVSASANPNWWNPNIITRELTTGEVEALIEDYEFAAKVVSTAGVDAIEIHAHWGYLTDQFMTALWNRRTDKYGGDLDGRLRLPLEFLKAAKRAAGDDFPVTCRYGLTHYLDGARTTEEGLEVARCLEAAGIDGLHIDAGCYESIHWGGPPTTQPPGLFVDLAEAAKKVVNVPVIAVGKLQYPELAERVLEDGKADFIALGRPLLADPEWPNKVKEGRPEDIIPCIGCHEGCMRRYFSGRHVSCAVNPACGREKESTISQAEEQKSVLVVGGGPAGMEAAIIAALRGHNVTLWEKGYSLGGNLIPAAVPTFKLDYKLLLDYLSTQIRKLGVVTKLGIEVTQELVETKNPDVVLIATGAKPIIPEYPGIERGIEEGRVTTAVEVLLGKKGAGEKVVIIGGGLVGCETALYLAQQGKEVTVIARHDAMRDMFWMNIPDLHDKLNAAKAKIMTYTNVLEITGKGVVLADERGEKSVLEADTIVIAVRLEPVRGLIEALQGKISEVYAIGDCVESRKVIDAIWEGFRTARVI